MYRKFILISLALFISGFFQAPFMGKADELEERTGPASSKILFQSFHVDRAPIEIQQNNMDLYLYGIKSDAAETLKTDKTVVIYQAPASSISLMNECEINISSMVITLSLCFVI